jgi:magnesium transporter
MSRVQDRPISALRDEWAGLDLAEQVQSFATLSLVAAEAFFRRLNPADQAALLLALPPEERRLWMRTLPPDDAVDCLQAAPSEARDGLVELLDETTRHEVLALLAYAEDDAGGLMNPRFARLRPNMRVDEALGYLRRQALERVATMPMSSTLSSVYSASCRCASCSSRPPTSG